MRLSGTARCTLVVVLLCLEIALAKKKKDYYQLLGVKKNCDDATLKKAYRKVRVLRCLAICLCGLQDSFSARDPTLSAVLSQKPLN